MICVIFYFIIDRIDGNKIGDRGSEALAAALMENSTLKLLT